MSGDVTAGTPGARGPPRQRPHRDRCIPRRFSGSAALTPEEQEQRALYAAILEYEQDHVSARRRLLLPRVPWGQRTLLWVQDACCPWVLWGKRP